MPTKRKPTTDTTSGGTRKASRPRPENAATLLELEEYGTHRKGCTVEAGETSPAFYVPPVGTVIEGGRTALLLRCNDAQCDAGIGWTFRNILDVLAVLKPGLGATALPGEEPA